MKLAHTEAKDKIDEKQSKKSESADTESHDGAATKCNLHSCANVL